MNYEPEALRQVRQRLDAFTQINSKSIYLATHDQDLETVLQTNDSLLPILEKLRQAQKIKDFSSIASLGTFPKDPKSEANRLECLLGEKCHWDQGKFNQKQRGTWF